MRIFVILVAVLFAAVGCQAPDPARPAAPNQGEDNPPGTPDEFCEMARVRWTPPTQNVDGSALTDLAGFRIYVGFESRNYSDVYDVDGPAQVQLDILNLEPGRLYYFSATAFTAAGLESRYSSEVTKTVVACD